MRVELNNTAKKQYKKLNEPYKSRIAAALDKLELEPPKGDIKKNYRDVTVIALLLVIIELFLI